MLTQLIKAGGIKLALQLLPMILTTLGNQLHKDGHSKLGDVINAAAPAVDAYETGNGPALYRSLSSVNAGLTQWLHDNAPKTLPVAPPPGTLPSAPQHGGGLGGFLGGIGKDVLQAETGVDLHNHPNG